jgi:hypothetical protein
VTLLREFLGRLSITLEPKPIPGHRTKGLDMEHLTEDPNDPRLTHGADSEPTDMAEVYLVLSEEERKKGFVRPVRRSYVHDICGGATRMGEALAETYAREPKFYGATYCVHCRMHKPVSEFHWEDGTIVGS